MRNGENGGNKAVKSRSAEFVSIDTLRTQVSQMPSYICICGSATNYPGVQSARTPVLDGSQVQPDDMNELPDNDFVDAMTEESHEHSSEALQSTSFLDDTDEDHETASGSSEDENLASPFDSEDEDLSDLTQLELRPNAQSSHADHLPSKLQGLSIADIAKSKWLAESFLVGECANGTKSVCV